MQLTTISIGATSSNRGIMSLRRSSPGVTYGRRASFRNCASLYVSCCSRRKRKQPANTKSQRLSYYRSSCTIPTTDEQVPRRSSDTPTWRQLRASATALPWLRMNSCNNLLCRRFERQQLGDKIVIFVYAWLDAGLTS